MSVGAGMRAGVGFGGVAEWQLWAPTGAGDQLYPTSGSRHGLLVISLLEPEFAECQLTTSELQLVIKCAN